MCFQKLEITTTRWSINVSSGYMEVLYRHSRSTVTVQYRHCTITEEALWWNCRKPDWQLLYNPYHTEFILWWVDYVYLFNCTKKKSKFLMQSVHSYFFNQFDCVWWFVKFAMISDAVCNFQFIICFMLFVFAICLFNQELYSSFALCSFD